MNIKDSWLKEGFVNEPVEDGIDIIEAIKKLKVEEKVTSPKRCYYSVK